MTNHLYWLMKKNLPAEVWDRILVGDGCWEWQGGSFRGGYGAFHLDGKAKKAHRITYQLWYEVDPGEQHVLHLCDNPKCCRPDHLMLGDHTENMRQRGQRDRTAHQKGEQHGKARLTAEQVKVIRSSAETGVSLARTYGVTPSTISDIRKGRIWTHI